ncbi:MAG: HAMP domain-containing protein [Chromatiales bacterium]|nr:HAMP domain-containing protein [Chromatiales bacterium]
MSLYLMGAATQNSAEFGRLYIVLLAVNIIGVITLAVLITANCARLVRQYRARAVGSRLTVRLLGIFVTLALLPGVVVYYFSLDFIARGIDSWFDVRFERALDDALELSRISLDERKREYMRRTDQIADALSFTPADRAATTLSDMRAQYDAYELTLIGASGHINAFSSANSLAILPHLPPEVVLRQVRQGSDYVGVDSIDSSGLYVRVVRALPVQHPVEETRLLQALYPVSSHIGVLADSIEEASSSYRQLVFLRDPLKNSFLLTLSLVLLLSLLTAVWAAFFLARRLVAPIRVLALGTRAVAAGDYDRQLPQHSQDEMGFLVQSFNDMTRRLAQARDETLVSQHQAEGERAYLRAVLGRLSSGVITIDRRRVIRTANHAAGQILGIDVRAYVSKPLATLGSDHEHLAQFVEAVRARLSGIEDWREEIIIQGPSGRCILMCGGASLADTEYQGGGNVLVFEDITALVQAQRDAAWGEVARRLAHEIKNPLTPIRLSAERLRHKYLRGMAPGDAEILDRSTHTIVQQVQVMEEMVKAFSEYARTPQLRLQPIDLHAFVEEVLDLYRGGSSQVNFVTEFEPGLPRVDVDPGRMRQLLHNLIKNALEAAPSDQDCVISIRASLLTMDSGTRMLEMRVHDNGPGLPVDMFGRFFEPYVTTKHKGNGLGLAIVKKIVEEHGGSVSAENAPEGGAVIVIKFALNADSMRAPPSGAAAEGSAQSADAAAAAGARTLSSRYSGRQE